MQYGLMFFSSNAQKENGNIYRLVLEASKFADEHGFVAVWTPERHFHDFGGVFPNPATMSAGLATITQHIQIRAGSVTSPLHHIVRLVEDWSVVDNLSNGRVALSFGAGWNSTDFILQPQNYENRHAVMHAQIAQAKRLWRGEEVSFPNSFGKEVPIRVFPRPVQPELPVWITSSGNLHTVRSAAALGAGIITSLIGQSLDEVAEMISVYRDELEHHGFARDHGKVGLMLHTHLGADTERVKQKVRTPFREYLRSAVKLEHAAARDGGTLSGSQHLNTDWISDNHTEELLDIVFERYFHGGALMGTPEDCLPLIQKLEAMGVDEVACLLDFFDDDDAILAGLPYLDTLRERTGQQALEEARQAAVDSFMDDLE